MKIVMTASEATPFAKTGGLADVTAALCQAFADLGHQVSLILPHYPQVLARSGASLPPPRSTGLTLRIPIGQKQVTGRLLQTRLPGSTVDVYLVDQPDYYDRPSLYQEGGRDYRDNCERFVFLSRAVLEAVRLLDLRPDVIHSHDWQTGLVPAMLKIENRHVPGLERTAAVFTVHNMAFQGIFWHWDMVLTGLDWKYFNWHQMEFFGNLNLLKSGLVFADMVTTVSPAYAQEIQSPELGCGLHGVIRARGQDVVGILNGVDTKIWNPAADRHLVQTYTAANVAAGKAVNKAALQKRVGLPIRSDVPLLGMVSRLTDQKGLDLILARAERLVEGDLQLVFLGVGEERLEHALQDLALRYPRQVATSIGYDDTLAHQIEAGADMALMPSRFEPCGLNQMYSLIYGTVPIVRAVGGLRDTVVDATPETLANHTANGFTFREYDAAAFEGAVRRALAAFADRAGWAQLVETGMHEDWSWRRSALQYLGVFERARSRYQCGEMCPASV